MFVLGDWLLWNPTFDWFFFPVWVSTSSSTESVPFQCLSSPCQSVCHCSLALVQALCYATLPLVSQWKQLSFCPHKCKNSTFRLLSKDSPLYIFGKRSLNSGPCSMFVYVYDSLCGVPQAEDYRVIVIFGCCFFFWSNFNFNFFSA